MKTDVTSEVGREGGGLVTKVRWRRGGMLLIAKIEKELVFATNPNFLIPLSLKPDGVNL